MKLLTILNSHILKEQVSDETKEYLQKAVHKKACIKGDCVNGEGEWSDTEGHYIGSFKDGKKDSGVQAGPEGDKFFKDGRLVVLRKPAEESGGLIDVALSTLGNASPVTAVLNSLPMNAKTFIKDLMGSVKMITEKDFSSTDLEVLKELVKKIKKEGRVYIDYEKDYKGSFRYKTLSRSFSDPLYRLHTTIGEASIGSNDKGETIVSDRYNFNDTLGPNMRHWMHGKDFVDILKLPQHSLYTKMRLIGDKYGSKEGEGAPVYINLGKLT